MAHSGYATSVEKEIANQSGMSVSEVLNTKTSGGAKFLKRLHDGMAAVVADVSSRSSAGATLITNISSDVSSNDTADGQNGLDNLPGSLKQLIKKGKMQGAVQSHNVNKGYYWVTGSKLYRFQNRNEFDTFQKALASSLTQTIISDLDLSINAKIKKTAKNNNQKRIYCNIMFWG